MGAVGGGGLRLFMGRENKICRGTLMGQGLTFDGAINHLLTDGPPATVSPLSETLPIGRLTAPP